MKRFSTVAVIVLALVVAALSSTSVSYAQEAAGFEVGRFVVCEGVADREPVGVTASFPSGADKVYAFLDARDIKEDTTVEFVWFIDDAEIARVSLKLGEGPRWRTYSSKTLFGMTGDWRVELQGAGGSVIDSAEFRVE